MAFGRKQIEEKDWAYLLEKKIHNSFYLKNILNFIKFTLLGMGSKPNVGLLL
jgi:hypothetical protein